MKTVLLISALFLSAVGYAQNAPESIVKGNQLYQQSQFDLAEAQYRKALEYDPENERAKYNLANTLQKQNKYEEAIKLLDGLAGSSKDNSIKSAAYYNQGVAYTKIKNLDASIESYKKALRSNPNDKEAGRIWKKPCFKRKTSKATSKKNPNPV